MWLDQARQWAWRILPAITAVCALALPAALLRSIEIDDAIVGSWLRILTLFATIGVLLHALFEFCFKRSLAPWIRAGAFLALFYAIASIFAGSFRCMEVTPPDDRIAMGSLFIALLLGLWATLHLWRSPFATHMSQSLTMLLSPSTVTDPRLTNRASDIAITSAHEAGHALMYACLARYPSSLRATSVSSADLVILGKVSASIPANLLTATPLSEWRMMLHLAGRIAEEVVVGVHSLGSTNDMAQWEMEANAYLRSGHDAFFFSDPRSALEIDHNASVLHRLRTSQIQRVRDFFQLNHAPLRDLALELQRVRTLDLAGLTPFLQRALFPPGFPSQIVTLLPDNVVEANRPTGSADSVPAAADADPCHVTVPAIATAQGW